jgi:hypothetical protein
MVKQHAEKTNCLIELHYLPSLEYFHTILQYHTIFVERHEYFVKQSYRSRCYINTSQGIETLIIPLTAKHGKTIITDIRVDYSQKWLMNHWRTIQSAYGKAPFFEHYADNLRESLFRRYIFLYDLNYELLTMCLKWLKLTIQIRETLSYQKEAYMDLIDKRNVISAKKQSSLDKTFEVKPYTQVFGNTFAGNLSIIDLVFCTGPQSLTIVNENGMNN